MLETKKEEECAYEDTAGHLIIILYCLLFPKHLSSVSNQKGQLNIMNLSALRSSMSNNNLPTVMI